MVQSMLNMINNLKLQGCIKKERDTQSSLITWYVVQIGLDC